MNSSPTATCGGLFAVAISLAVAGCERSEQIRTYTVKKEVAAPTAEAPQLGEPADRMLTAVFPDGDRAWFFKVVGPLGAIDAQADAINEFFTSIRSASSQPHPEWKLPAGWTEQPGTGMRIATLTIPTDGKPLELSVTSLPWTSSKAELLSNVNRWRGQMQLAPIDEADLASSTRELKAGDATLTVVDLRGRMQTGGMTPPFANSQQLPRLRPGEPTSPGGQTSPTLPPGHPSVAATNSQPTAPAAVAPFQFEAPKTWQSIPATGMRKLAFVVSDVDKKAEFTAMDFPASAGPMISDPVANVNRWRGEVGLDPVTAEQLKTVTESFTVDGPNGKLDATLVVAIPDASQPKAERGTLAAMVNTGKQIWFFKLSGNRDLVATERDNFESFLKSVRFAAAGGAENGN